MSGLRLGRRLIALLGTIFLLSGLIPSNAWAAPIAVATYQIKVVDPRTDTPQAQASIYITSMSYDEKGYGYKAWQQVSTNSSGLATISLAEGVHFFNLMPSGNDPLVLERTHVAKVFATGGITFQSGVSTTTQPFILPLATANVWGNVVTSNGNPMHNSGIARVEAMNTQNGDYVVRYPRNSNAQFGMALYPGTWQLKAVWQLGDETRELYNYGQSNPVTIEVDANNNPVNFSSVNGITLSLKVPTVSGTLRLPDGSRVSGWKIVDPDPNWSNIKEGRSEYINLNESSDSPAQGDFAIWIDPTYKPSKLTFSVVSNGIGYSHTLDLPSFTTNLDLGTIMAQTSNKVTVDLNASSYSGSLSLQILNAAECSTCWTWVEDTEVQNLQQITFFHLKSGASYRVIYHPSESEKEVLETSSSSFTISSASTNISISPTVVSIKQFKVTNPTTNSGVSGIRVQILKNDKTFFKSGITNSEGIVSLGAPEGTFRLLISPEDEQSALLSREFQLTVSSAGVYTINNGVSTATQPFLLPLLTSNVWGSVTVPAGTPENIAGGVQIKFIKSTTGEIEYASSSAPGVFYKNLSAGTWQVKTLWYGKGNRIYQFGPADTTTVVVNSDGTSDLNPSGSGLVLALKAPNVRGIITKPDGSRISGWLIEDSEPDWAKIKAANGDSRPLSAWESGTSTSSGEFALWIDPNLKPNALRFSLETEDVAYGKTVPLPSFTSTYDFGTFASLQAENLRVNLPSTDLRGNIRLEHRKKSDCEKCWIVTSSNRSYETYGNTSVTVKILTDSDYDYRFIFEPASDELRYISTATPALTFPFPTSGYSISLKSPSIIGRVPSLIRGENKKYFAEVTLLKEETYSSELVAKGYPANRWFTQENRILYSAPAFAFTLQSGANYRFYINPSVPSLSTPSFLTDTLIGPATDTSLGEINYSSGSANLSGAVSANGAVLANHSVMLYRDSRTWDKPLFTQTDSAGKYYFKVPAGTYRIYVDPPDSNGEFFSKQVTCAVTTNVAKLDCNIALPQNNFRFKLTGTASEAINVSSLITKIDEVTDPSATLLSLAKYFYDYETITTQQPVGGGSGVYGVQLTNGRYLFKSFATINSGVGYGTALYQVIVANNVVVSVKNLVGGASITPASEIYSLALPVANVTGTLTLDGESVQNFYGYVQPNNQIEKEYIPTNNLMVDGTGRFYDYKLPGDYRYEFRTYSDSLVSDNALRLKSCAPTSLTSQTTCNLSLNRNLKGLVKRSNNLPAAQGKFGVYERRSDGSISLLSSGSLRQTGEIDLALTDGEYQLDIQSYTNNSGQESRQIWITVSGGVATNVRNKNSTSALPLSDNRFQISTQFMGIAGTVVAPNGTTPIANSQVNAYDNKFGYGATSQSTGRFEIPSINNDGELTVEAEAPIGNRVEMGRSNPVKVSVTNGVGSSDLLLTLRTTTLRGTVFGSAGAITGGWIEFRRVDNAETGQWSWAGNAEVSQQGQFGAVLAPGTYYYIARPWDNTAGVATISGACVVPTTGFITCDTTLTQPNFVAKILKSDGSYSTNSSFFTWLVRNDDFSPTSAVRTLEYVHGNIDKEGRLTTRLTNGEWRITVYPGQDAQQNNVETYFRVVVTNNLIVSVEKINSDSTAQITAVDGIYPLPLNSVNLTGQITFQNKTYGFNSLVRVVREVSTEKGTWYEQFASRWTRDEGRFELNVKPGTYQLEVVPYIWNVSDFTNGLPAFTRKLNCIVPESGSGTCDVALNTANFLGTVTDAADVQRRQTSINLVKLDANGNRTWIDRGIQVDESANFQTYLEDGSYIITITPYWEYRLNLIERSYKVTVLNGAITEVRNLTTNQVITAGGNNRFTLKFGTPSVMGTVLMPGTSTEAVANIRIEVRNTNNVIMWEYQTYTNNEGKFSLALPDGQYLISAVNDGKVRNAYKSAKVPVTVTNATAPDMTIRLREANLTGVVVLPGTSQPVANVNVNLYVDGEWHYTWTDESGTFGMFVENPTPNCPDKCYVSFNTWALSGYLPKNYPINAVGNLGNLAIGVANTRVSVLLPMADGTNSVNIGGWILVHKLDANGNVIESSWGSVNKSGYAFFSLDQGAKYRMYAYPGSDMAGKFSMKTFDIAAHNQSSEQVTYTITFNTPNLNFTIRGWDGLVNSWGYYRVLDSQLNEVAQGSLNFSGQGALSITTNGEYSMIIYPGKSKGVVKNVTFTVTDGVISSSTFTITNSSATIDLPRGNVEGFTRYFDNSIAKEVLITATRSDNSTVVVKTSSSETGNYFLNLDRTYTWNISFFDPASSRVSQLVLAPEVTDFTLRFPEVIAA